MGLKRCPVCQMSQDDKAIVCPCGHRFVTVVGGQSPAATVPAWSPQQDPPDAIDDAPSAASASGGSDQVTTADALCFLGTIVGWAVIVVSIYFSIDTLMKGSRSPQSMDTLPVIFGGLQGVAIGMILIIAAYIVIRVPDNRPD